MTKMLLDNMTGIAGELIKLLIMVVTGVVILDRLKKCHANFEYPRGSLG